MKKLKQFFRTYTPFALNEIKRNLAYKGHFYFYVICDLYGAFISYYLWMAIYKSSDSGTLGGLTGSEIVIYIFMTYVTSNLVCIGVSEEISDDVVEGKVAMQLIKPIDYRISLISKAFGYMLFAIVMPAIFVWGGLEIYKVRVLHTGMTPVFNILCFLVSTLMSFFIYVLFDYCFGMLSFFTTYIFGMMMAKNALLSFLSGQLIPLSFFPAQIRTVLEWMPFSSMIYTPVMIYLGKYTGSALLFVLARQLFWVVALYLLGSVIWKQVTKRLVVLGG